MKLAGRSIGIYTPLTVVLILAAITLIMFIVSQQQVSSTHLSQARAVSLSTPAISSTGKQTSQPVSNASTSGTAQPSPSATNSSSNVTTVDVNGKTVVVPANSSYSQTTSSGGSTTSVNVHSSESVSGSGANSANTSSVTVNTH